MKRFHQALKEARLMTPYRYTSDFANRVGFKERTYQKYETGERVPSTRALERLLSGGPFPDDVAGKLRKLHRLALAEKNGVDLSLLEQPIDLSDLAKKIALEVEFELKRYNIDLTPRIKRVCVRRIQMILDSVLRRT
jgi:transcriptional regulator with XRE-family HTH domain